MGGNGAIAILGRQIGYDMVEYINLLGTSETETGYKVDTSTKMEHE